MGLDAVELVMDVEDQFGITIQHSEAEHVRTVGDLVDLIKSRIAAAHVARCPTLTSFMRLRSFVREIAGNERLRIRTRTRVVDVLDPIQRRLLWKRLDELGCALPSMRRSPAVRKTLASIAIAMFVLSIVIAARIDLAILPLAIAITAVVSYLMNGLTVSFRVYPPDNLATFGVLAERLAGVNVATKQLHLNTNEMILKELTPIIAETLGVDSSEVALSARFVEDLGMG